MVTVFDAADALIDDARRDEGFKDWINRFYAYIRKVSNFPSFIPHLHFKRHSRLCWKPATFLRRSVTAKVMRYANRDASTGTRSTAATLICCSMRSEIGSLPWPRTH